MTTDTDELGLTPAEARELRKEVKALIRSLRGYNGNMGLLAQVIILQRDQVTTLEEVGKVQALIKDQAGSMATASDLREHRVDEHQESDSQIAGKIASLRAELVTQIESNAEKTLTWPWLLEKIGVPVIMVFLLWFFTQVTPWLIQQIGGP